MQQHTEQQAVQRAIDLMGAGRRDECTLEGLARAAGFSKFHFCRVFRRVTGLTPLRYLETRRMETAKRLLADTSLTVLEITVELGLSSPGTFSSRFSRQVGMSPSQYRRTARNRPRQDRNCEDNRQSTAAVAC